MQGGGERREGEARRGGWLKALVSLRFAAWMGARRLLQDAKRRHAGGQIDGSIDPNRRFSVEGVHVGRCCDCVGEKRGRPAGERKRHKGGVLRGLSACTLKQDDGRSAVHERWQVSVEGRRCAWQLNRTQDGH